MKRIIIPILIFLFTACSSVSPSQTIITPTVPAVTPSPDPYADLPPVEGPEPSTKVAAFYYPWYGNPTLDGEWIHWEQNGHNPPLSIGSDYFPLLGAYSSNDPQVVAQHMAWLRQAGVGVIISTWWGQGSYEDRAAPLLLEMAERYGIKVAFHIEPYSGRTAISLVADVKYLYRKYGESPAFFRSNAISPNSPGGQSKGMFFVWSITFDQDTQTSVEAQYWLPAMDAIHALPEGGLIIANTVQSNWINDGHVDGLYNYITLDLVEQNGFDWARSMPADALYIPSVMPGNSARRVGYPETTYVARLDGETYNEQWTAALGTGVEPEMVTITSFNEWHEGSMIEPPALGADDGAGYAYEDFGALPAEGYLTLTHDWVQKYLAIEWPDSKTYRARIKIATTADWTTLNLISGGVWMRPERISASESATQATMDSDAHLALNQTLEDAKAGDQVEMIWDIFFTGLDPTEDLVLQIDRGSIGSTQVTIYNYTGETPIQVGDFNWSGVTTGLNSYTIQIPAGSLMNPTP